MKKGINLIAYSSEVGNVNVDVLKEQLKVDRKGAEVVFQNEELFIISPSIQNGSKKIEKSATKELGEPHLRL